MGRIARTLSPAKVNLHLDVLQRRDDGYHELLSLFQMISWADELTVRSLKNDGVCEIRGNLPVPMERTTVHRAVEVFRRATGIRNGVEITVRKRIPMGAGLGGGSSNGAFTLAALNALFSAGLSDRRMIEVASEIGSDVPFFCAAPAAVVTGRGETVRPVAPRGDYHIVLVYPDLSISTAEAFSWLDRWRQDRKDGGPRESGSVETEDGLRRRYASESPRNWGFRNAFFDVLCIRYPVFRRIRDDLLDLGADFAAVSGSGSTMFGVFSDSEASEAAAERMRSVYSTVMVAEPLARMPVSVLE